MKVYVLAAEIYTGDFWVEFRLEFPTRYRRHAAYDKLVVKGNVRAFQFGSYRTLSDWAPLREGM